MQCMRHGFNPWVGKLPWRRAWQPTPVFLPGESHGQRSLAGYSPWGCRESDATERLTLNTYICQQVDDRYVLEIIRGYELLKIVNSLETSNEIPPNFFVLGLYLLIVAILEIKTENKQTNKKIGTSKLVWWLRRQVPNEGPWVRSLVGELDPTTCTEESACLN